MSEDELNRLVGAYPGGKPIFVGTKLAVAGGSPRDLPDPKDLSVVPLPHVAEPPEESGEWDHVGIKPGSAPGTYPSNPLTRPGHQQERPGARGIEVSWNGADVGRMLFQRSDRREVRA